MSVHQTFASYLRPRLPLGCTLRVYHVSARPTSCPSLFAAAPGQIEEETWCESHFLAISQARSSSQGSDGPDHIIVLGVEVLIFTSLKRTTAFVSKADSTGFLNRAKGASQSTSIAHATIAAFLEFLSQPRNLETPLVLSLFARSQNQYLFPGSIENANKHVLDDRQLIKWWCRVLDNLVPKSSESHQFEPHPGPFAHVVIPGCDEAETRAFFPPSARTDPPTKTRWNLAYPDYALAEDSSLPPRCLIPRLPDDPKSRFLEDLDRNKNDETGEWRGVKTLDRFWESMSYRQECSAGRLVGFVWLIYAKSWESDNRKSQDLNSTNDDESFVQTGAKRDASRQDSVIKPSDQDLDAKSTTDKEDVEATQKPLRWPTTTRGQFVLSSEQYSDLMDYLLDLDFAGEDTAAESTKDWVGKAVSLAGEDAFGIDIEGELIPVTLIAEKQVRAVPNLITGVRKKRKAKAVELVSESIDSTQRPVKLVLEVDQHRKKAKS